MTTFFIVAAVLLLSVVALVGYPLIRGRESAAEDRTGEVVGLSRERLDELKRQKQGGEISESEYTERVSDLEAQLSDDLHAPGTGGTVPGRGGGRWVGIAAAVFIPMLSGLLYLTLGQPQALTSTSTPTPGARATAGGTAPGSMSASDIDDMVSGLAARLEQNPDDPEGWFMLGRSYMVLERYDDAAKAFSRLRALVGDVPDVLVREATALAMAGGGNLSGEPARLVHQALAEQPDHAQALWMAATHAYQTRNYETALKYYRRVRPLVDGEPRRQVDGMIADLAEKGYGEPIAEDAAPEEDATAAADAGASLQVNVALDSSLQADVDGGDTVFVFARAVNGPPMPLAVVRKTVADLPVTVTLDDSQAMTPQFKLSSFERVTVGARISASGEPIAQPGDLEGASPPLATDTPDTIEVNIDRVVPAGDGN